VVHHGYETWWSRHVHCRPLGSHRRDHARSVRRWSPPQDHTVHAARGDCLVRRALKRCKADRPRIGATAFTLGVDCFTRAGLKEFYIYNLGFHSLFPKLGDDKYPLTQTMQVELGVLGAVVLVSDQQQCLVAADAT
jgi:hypothetical protein